MPFPCWDGSQPTATGSCPPSTCVKEMCKDGYFVDMTTCLCYQKFQPCWDGSVPTWEGLCPWEDTKCNLNTDCYAAQALAYPVVSFWCQDATEITYDKCGNCAGADNPGKYEIDSNGMYIQNCPVAI